MSFHQTMLIFAGIVGVIGGFVGLNRNLLRWGIKFSNRMRGSVFTKESLEKAVEYHRIYAVVLIFVGLLLIFASFTFPISICPPDC